MNKTIKRKWVKALRSGRYRQTQLTLKNRHGYCCLGVLRQLMHRGSELADPHESLLAEKHLKECGLLNSQQQKLAYLNDDEDQTFPEIAGWIEKNL